MDKKIIIITGSALLLAGASTAGAILTLKKTKMTTTLKSTVRKPV